MSLKEMAERLASAALPGEQPVDFFALSENWSPAPWFKPTGTELLRASEPLPEALRDDGNDAPFHRAA